MENLTVTLKISRHFRGALLLHNSFIEAHLLFGDSYCECRVPYDAIWGVTSEFGDTTSWLEGFNDTRTPPAESGSSEDTGVLSKYSHRSESPLPSGPGVPLVDKSNQSTTPLQIVESVGTRFKQLAGTDAGLRGAESSDKTIHEDSGREDSDVIRSGSLTTHTNGEIEDAYPENSNIPGESGSAEKTYLKEESLKDDEEEGTEVLGTNEGDEAPSYPPRLQPVLRTPADQILSSQTSTDLPTQDERSHSKDATSSATKAPTPRGHQSGRSNSAHRPKLVRVK
jgi:hypothetical protein